ncbi:MAG: hypothetical protein HQM02_03325 [Magnetococcales bacterium]|nr:hypothetical protein [Magnetococcales bacterium]
MDSFPDTLVPCALAVGSAMQPDTSCHRLVLVSGVVGLLCGGGLAVGVAAGDAGELNTDRGVMEQQGAGDIRERGPEAGGRFGDFSVGKGEVQPDDPPFQGPCPSKNGNQDVLLWDSQGFCLSEGRAGHVQK